jgi:hypothetical protein
MLQKQALQTEDLRMQKYERLTCAYPQGTRDMKIHFRTCFLDLFALNTAGRFICWLQPMKAAPTRNSSNLRFALGEYLQGQAKQLSSLLSKPRGGLQRGREKVDAFSHRLYKDVYLLFSIVKV